MSIRFLSLSVPAAFLALGMIALSTASSHATDNARDDYATSVNHASSFNNTVGFTVAHQKKRHTVGTSKRFSGFGFRGDGFRNSGKYN